MLRVGCNELSPENLILTRTYHFYIVDINTELNIIWTWQSIYETYPVGVIRGKITQISLRGLWIRSFYQFQFYALFYGSSCKLCQTKFNRTKTEIYLRASVMLVTWIDDICSVLVTKMVKLVTNIRNVSPTLLRNGSIIFFERGWSGSLLRKINKFVEYGKCFETSKWMQTTRNNHSNEIILFRCNS